MAGLIGNLSRNKILFFVNLFFLIGTLILCWVNPIPKISKYYVNRIGTNEEYEYQIYGDNVLLQEFVCNEEDVNEIDLPLSTINAANYFGEYTVELRNKNGETIQGWANERKELIGNYWKQFFLDNTLEQGETYYIHVYAPQLTEDNLITLSGVESISSIGTVDGIQYKSCLSTHSGRYNDGCIFIALAHAYINYFAVISFVLLFLLINYILIRKDKVAEKETFVITLILGIIMMIIISPGNGPDESYHYYSSYILSNVIIGEKHICVIDSCDLFLCSGRNSFNDFIQTIEYKNVYFNNKEIIEYVYNKLDYPIAYLPQALGISVARIIGLHGTSMYMLGRFVNLLVYSIIVSFAVKITPFYKTSFLLLAINPMSMHQASSLSYDMQINGISLLYFAYILKLVSDKRNVYWRDYIVTFVSILLIAPIKFVYYIELVLFFLVLVEKKEKKRRAFIEGVGLVLLCFIFTVLIQQSARASMTMVQATITASNGYSYNDKNIYSISGIFREPIMYMKVYLTTVYNCLNQLFLEMFGQKLARLYVNIKEHVIWLYVGLLFLSTDDKEAGSTGILSKKFIFGVFAVTIIEIVMITATGFLMTPFGYTQIVGLQGRYYIPCIPQLLLVLCWYKNGGKVNSLVILQGVMFVYLEIIVDVMSQISF
ncbi:Uncharacterized membrane protein [Pseudobutyrivibrio sp. 49]|uniref:DUF2142 domain-containing protein n=1 Tax=Pseudobutyrivibrio sp. 49 TaxID=1855344 RepID=UPI00088DB342|nr:DUF2142 domain-containing protein [Pseudobutyrivibrio sp. 49]SDH59830.1 Uncharacterized membrane protein [Pseudobutyrivibrio sp. 49]